MPDKASMIDVAKIISGIYSRLKSVTLTSGALQIKSAAKPTCETGAAWYGLVDGYLVTLTINNAMAALVGTVVNATFNVFVFSIDSAGTKYTQMGTAGATLKAVAMPIVPDNRAVIGMVIINPTGTGDFVGGTTDLDDATKTPNAVYINAVGANALIAKN